MPMPLVLQKIADAPNLTQFAADNPEAALLPLSGIAGGTLVHKTRKRPAADILRGTLTGLGTGVGMFGGARLGGAIGNPGDGSMLVGGGLGGLAGYAIMQKLLAGLRAKEAPKKREKRSISPALSALIQTKQLSDQRNYHDKHLRLRALVDKHPDDFVIDSEKDGILGITHTPTGFQLHVPRRVMPANMKRVDNVQATNP